ncbi:hypothetical protein P4S72_01055 [Vibrio sp. PP-XX7]
MRVRDRIESLEQQIYVACSEGDKKTMNRLEKQLEHLQELIEHPIDEEMLDESYFSDENWR